MTLPEGRSGQWLAFGILLKHRKPRPMGVVKNNGYASKTAHLKDG